MQTPPFWPDIFWRTVSSLWDTYGWTPAVVVTGLTWLITRFRAGGLKATLKPSGGWSAFVKAAALSLAVGSLVLLATATMHGFRAAAARDAEQQRRYESVASNAKGISQRYEALETRVRACDERRAVIDRLGHLREFFALKLSFAAFGSPFPDSPFDTVEKNWQGYTSAVADALDLFRSEKRLFSAYEVSQMQLPAARFYVRSPYKHPTSEHARMWQECNARMNLIDEIVGRLQLAGCELPTR